MFSNKGEPMMGCEVRDGALGDESNRPFVACDFATEDAW